MPRLTTRDYKRTRRTPSAARLKEFALGVLVGAVLATAAFLIVGARARHEAAAALHGHSSDDSSGSAPHAPAPDDTSANSPGAEDGASSPQTASAGPGAQPQQYDFYRMLPSFKVPVPHDDEHASGAPPQAKPLEASQPARVAGARSYLLQVGSYHSRAEADQVRARLAHFGITAQVQHVVDGNRIWNRVRIGPLSDAELTRVRDQLRTANIHALVIRADR